MFSMQRLSKEFLNKLLFPLLFFLCACSYGHKDDASLHCVHLVDSNGIAQTVSSNHQLDRLSQVDFSQKQPYQRVLRVYDQGGTKKCILTTYHPNGYLWQYLEGEDFAANGIYHEFFPNGQKKIEAFVIAGPCDISPTSIKQWQFHGIAHVWNEQGIQLAEISYYKGQLHGPSIYYHLNGKIEKTLHYDYDALSGETTCFYPDGSMRMKQQFVSGKPHGHSLGYFKGEAPSFIEEYNNGLLETGIYYNKNGTIISQIANGFGQKAFYEGGSLFCLCEYQNGIQQGKVDTFYKNGDLASTYCIKDHKKHGEEITYYSISETKSKTPKPKLSIQWVDDQVQGIVKTWYQSGTLESQREMLQNCKNGHLISWYQDGSILCMEEYENDKLVSGSYFKKGDSQPVSKVHNGSGLATIYDGKTGGFLRKVTYANGIPAK
jgi:antitoxin component YwqK of YwqJK toxin-antitoxin module